MLSSFVLVTIADSKTLESVLIGKVNVSVDPIFVCGRNCISVAHAFV